jgi:hypothetical protein
MLTLHNSNRIVALSMVSPHRESKCCCCTV